MALIIDDMGHSIPAARPFLEMDLPLTLSFLPERPHSRSLAEEGFARGKTIFLHLPMEPRGYPGIDPGGGVILTSQSHSVIRRILEQDLGSVPHAIGMNNHMGSMATEDREVMRQVMEFAGEKGLMFIDSRTTAGSVALSTAREMNIPSVERDIFLDNDRNEEAIFSRATEVLDLAQARGWAIGIGHPYPETARAIKRASLEAETRGVLIVPIEEIVKYAGSGN